MRGKGFWGVDAGNVNRITPAYAGKSNNNMKIPSSIWDHPRLCGEKSVPQRRVAWCGGSPPPMRGKVALHMKFVQHHRITPAYAGKSI